MNSESADPLDLPATPARLRTLAAQGALGESDLDRALRLVGHAPDAARWARFLEIVLLALGLALLVAGAIFFFAFNWADIPRLAKLGLMEAGLVALVGASLRLGSARLADKVALTAAALLVGGLLALFGQVYHIEADSYSLFLGWAALIVGWAAISRFAPLWLLVIALLNLALILFVLQTSSYRDDTTWVFLAVSALNSAALAAWEVVWAYGKTGQRWPQRVLAFPAFGALLIPSALLVVGWGFEHSTWAPLALVLMLGMGGIALYYYTAIRRDAFMPLVQIMCIIGLSIALMVRVLPLESLWFIVPPIIIGQSALGVMWLQSLAKTEKGLAQ